MDINLIPQETVVQRYSFSIFAIIFGLCIAFIMVFMTLGIIRYEQANQDLSSVTQLNQRQQTLQTQISTAQADAGQRQNLMNVQAGLGLRIDVKQFTSELLGLQGSNTLISDVSLTSGTANFSGTVQSLQSLANYVQKVDVMPNVLSVSIQSVTKQGRSIGYAFQATITFSSTQGGK